MVAGGDDVLARIVQSINEHDLDRLVGCFALDVHSETPAHPARNFVGRDQVRRNWAQIFGAVQDIQAAVVDSTIDRNVVWSELEFRGHRPDGGVHVMRGITILTVASGEVADVRFYMEPVDEASLGPDAAIARLVGRPSGADTLATSTSGKSR